MQDVQIKVDTDIKRIKCNYLRNIKESIKNFMNMIAAISSIKTLACQYRNKVTVYRYIILSS